MLTEWSPTIVQQLNEIAAERGITTQALVLEIVTTYLRRQETEAEADERHADVLSGKSRNISETETYRMLYDNQEAQHSDEE